MNKLLQAVDELLHLNICDQEGLRPPSPQQWFDAFNALAEAREEVDQDAQKAAEDSIVNEMLTDWHNGIIWDLSEWDESDKTKFIKGLIQVAGQELAKAFVAFKLKNHIEGVLYNESTKEYFTLSFKKDSNDQVLASSRSIGEDGCKQEAIEFVTWRDSNFVRSVREDRLNMYYSIEDRGKRNSLLTYLTIEQLYTKWQESKGGKP